MLTADRGRFARARRPARTVARALVAGGFAILLASCARGPSTPTGEHFSSAEYGVPGSPRVVTSGQPVPKGGGRYLVGDPYRIAGKTYVPREYTNYSAVGLASWYGRGFHGRRTANGEVYDVADLSAAHPTMPLPSYARVTNLANGRSVVVRVNDRGPYKRGRLIDVSETVAAMLDFKRSGTARVKVDYVGPARMDGLDRAMLLASYQTPDGAASTMVASAPIRTPRYILASAPVSRAKPPSLDFSIADPTAITPAYVAPGMGEDSIGPLILRTSFSSSYAAADTPTPAQQAAASLAGGHNSAPAYVATLDRARRFAPGQPALSASSFSSR